MAIDTAKLKDLLQKLISRRWNQESFKLLLFEIENLSEEEETFFLNTVRDASIGYLVSFCSGFTKIKELQPSTRYSLVDKFDAMFVQKHQEVNLALVISPNGEQKIFKNPTLIFLEHPENKLACAYLGKVYLDGIPSTVEPNFNKAMELFKNRFNHIDSESAFKILLKNQKLEGPFLSSDEASILSNKIKRLSKPTLAYILDIIKQSWEKDEYPIWFVIANLKQHLSPKTCPLIEEFNVIFDQKFQELVDAYIKTPEDPISAKNVISQKIKIYFDNLQISEEKQNRILALSTNDVSDTEKSNILTLQGEVYLHQKKYDSAIQSLQSAIALKHSGAMSTRAHMHIHGLGGEKNYSEAFSHLDNAMELGNAVAINGRGYMYEQGLGGEKNYAKAIERFEKAADLRNPNAMYNRAHMHANALGGERNYSKAIELSEKSIPLGNTSAMTLRACMHMQGFGGDKNYAKAIVLFEKAILLENAYAMAFRAYMHMQGFGGDKNYAKAIELLEKAILLGNSKALYYRALMYINGWGSEKNLQKASELCFQTTLKGDKEALKMLTSLAEKDPDACFYLGKVYFLGSPEPNLIKPEFEKAVTLFKKSFNLTDDPEIAFKILLEDQKLEGPFLSSDEAKILLNKIANLSETKLSPIINIIEQSWGKDEYPIWFAIANLKQHVSPKTCPLIEKFHSIFDQKFQELVDIYIKTPEDPISEKNTLSQKIEIYFENHQISEEQQKRILALSTHDVLEPEKSNILTLQGKVYLHQKKYDFAIKTLQPAIELKHSSAMSTRARMHIFGLGGDKNYAAAIILLNDPILSSNPAAINSRGYMYEHGLGGDKNYDKAIERFEKAADLGDSNAIYNRAYIHANALGGKRNYSKAIELSEKAILLGDSNAIILRALMYIYGLGGDKNYPKAIALLKKAILLGNSSAMYYLALMYINGWGSEKDLKKATELCFRAALNGNKDALEKLTYLAEKEKDPHACFYLGKVYLLGVPNLIEADLFKAMESFKKNLDLIDSETAFRILLENKKLKTPILSSDEAENLSNKLKDLWETQLNPIRNIIKQSWEQHENSILSLIKNLKQLSYFKPSFTSTFDKLFNFFDNIFNQILEKLIKAYIEKQEEPTLKKILTYFDDDLISAKQVSQIFYLPIDTYEGVLKSNILYLQGKVCLHLSKKYPEAIKCFSQAISLGNSKAMNDLAMMYEKGRASPSRTKDIQAAAELYFQAFIKGYEEALQNLGRLQQENKEHAHVCFYLGEAYLFNKSAVKPVQEWYKIIFYLQSILNVKTLSASDAALTHFMLAKIYDSEDKIYLSKWHLDRISDESLAVEQSSKLSGLRESIKQEITSRSLSLPPDINIPSKNLEGSLARLVKKIKNLQNPKTLLFFNKSESYSETTTYIFNIFLYQLTTYQNALKEKQTPEIAGQLFATLQDMKSFLSQISTVGGEPPEGLKQLLESLQNEIKTLTPTPNFKISSSNKETPKKPKSSSANPSLEVTPNTSSPKPRDYFCEIQKLFAQIEQKPHSKNDALTKLVDEMQTNVCFSDVLNQLKENQENTPAYKNIFYLQTILNVTTLSPLNAALTHLALAGLYYDQTKFYLSEWHLNQIPQTVLAELPDITHLRNTIKEEIGKKEPLLTERQRSDLPYHIKNALIQSIKDVTKLENPSFIENSLSRVSSSLSFDTTTPIILNIFLWQLTKYQGAFDDNPNSADQIYTALEDAKELLSSFNKTLFTEKNPPAKLTTLSKTLETCLEKSLGEPLDFSDLLPKNKTFNRNLNSED